MAEIDSQRGVSAEAESNPPLRVLLVEDSTDDAELVLRALAPIGRKLESKRVDNAAQLSAALHLDSWDLVLCDYALPGFDALAALAIMKRERLDVPFIIVSGTMGEATAVAAMKAGAHDFFSKGNLTRLTAAVERELRESEMRRERNRLREQLLLSDRLIAIGTLAASVAHEINNPLAYVIGNIDYALERLTKTETAALSASDCAELIAALKHAREGSERIRVTTRDLRVFCRTDETAVAPVNVVSVIESAISMAFNEIQHRARIVRNFESVPLVAANESRLGQVFLNLLINAAQAIEDADPNRHEVRVSTRAAEGCVMVEIGDTGRGMSPEVLEQLFQPFFTTKPVGVGTGLGLSICRGILQELGGAIHVDSELGRGTKVCVRIPTGHLSETKRNQPPVQPAARRARILVIDDEPALCQLVQRVLSPEHEVVVTVDARVGLRELEAGAAFDAVLCDLMMPEMTGMDFHAKLEQRLPRMAERVIFLTGGAFSSVAVQFLERVQNPRLDKPFDANTLRGAVAKLITHQTERAALSANL